MGSLRRDWRAISSAWVSLCVAGCHLAVTLTIALPPGEAVAQPPRTTPSVERGQQYYEQARFDEAIGLLKELVERGALGGEDLQKAREILARSYVKRGYPVLAKDMFKAILRQEPAWRPDPIRVPPDETAVFDMALREFENEGGAPPSTQQQPARTDTTATATPTPQPVSPAVIAPPVTSEKSSSIFSKWWFWAGAGGAALAIALAAGGGGDETPESDLPGFPPPPQ